MAFSRYRKLFFSVTTDPFDIIDDPWGDGYGVGTHVGSQRYSINRHNDGINMGFLDGHVGNVKVDDLFTLQWNKQWSMQGL